MNITYNPLSYLLAFVAIIVLLFFVLRPNKGLLHQIIKYFKFNDRVILEDILKYLYKRDIDLQTNNISTLFLDLKYSKNKIKDTLDKMLNTGLITIHEEVISLSVSGNQYALRILRAHRLWEKYLSEKTGYDSKDWHNIAEEKEHELDETSTDNLSSLLGNPIYDPHGKPIPRPIGKSDFLEAIHFTDLAINTKARIIDISKSPELVYDQIIAENIHIGAIINLMEISKNRVVFHSENKEFTLSPAIAKNIILSIIEIDNSDDENIARLSDLKKTQKASILGLSKECRGENRRRLLDLGFVPGALIEINLLNPLGDPTCYLIKGTSIALRKKQSSKIFIKELKHGE